MTAQINRSARFVDEKGALTLYGWSVLKGFWNATGGAVGIDAGELAALAAGPLVQPMPPQQPDTAPVAVFHQTFSDVGPV